jgi:hypothetical protein
LARNLITIYSSLDNNCPHIFSVVPLLETTVFPQTLFYFCSSCKKEHFFNKIISLFASTPSQISTAYSYAKKIGVNEYDVKLKI